jgi:hypothetical protein
MRWLWALKQKYSAPDKIVFTDRQEKTNRQQFEMSIPPSTS